MHVSAIAHNRHIKSAVRITYPDSLTPSFMDSPTDFERWLALKTEQEQNDEQALLVEKWFGFLRKRVYHGKTLGQVVAAMIVSQSPLLALSKCFLHEILVQQREVRRKLEVQEGLAAERKAPEVQRLGDEAKGTFSNTTSGHDR